MAQVSTAAVSAQVALRVMRADGVPTGPDGAEEMPLAEPQVQAHIGAVSEGRRNQLPFGEGDRVSTPRSLEEANWQYTATLQDA